MNLLLSLLLSLTFLHPASTDGGGKKSKKEKTVTVEGAFSSERGVMKPLSCYCYDSGYITTGSGDEIAICFEKNEFEEATKGSDKFSCPRIRVTGVYVEKTIAPGNDSPCPAGTKRILKVSKFDCLE